MIQKFECCQVEASKNLIVDPNDSYRIHLDSLYPTISYVDIRYRRLTYDIVVQTYYIVHNIVCTLPIGYPMYTMSYVNTTI